MGLPLEKLSTLKGKGLRDELERLRGAQTFTTHRGRGVPQRIKDGGAENNGKKTFKLVAIGAAVCALVYFIMQ